MFSPDIVSSEEFVTMPISSQALYFHLGMVADDDGFVQPKLIMRTLGANDDDLKVLLAKRFLLQFDSGVVVVKHWLIHNMIRLDRYKPTRFQDEKKTLQIKDNRAYTDVWQPTGNQLATQVRLGKDSIEERTLPQDINLKFLEELPKEVVEEFKVRFKCEDSEIRTKARILADYCRSKGKRYKDYKAFLANALRKDFGERPPKARVPIYDTSSGKAIITGYK